MNSSLLSAAALAALALLGACEQKEKPLAATPPPSVITHVRVLDADALVIDGHHLRLANAYAPESLLQTRCWAESIASDRAAAFVRDLVDHARSYEFKVTGKRDDHEREYATVTFDGVDLGDTLYNNGLAARVVEPRFDWCQPISQKAEGAPKLSSLYAPGS